MQSISATSTYIHPVESSESGDDSDYGVLHLEKLLNKIFGDELDKALATESQSEAASNLIEFPLIQELVSRQYQSSLEQQNISNGETLDFTPEAFSPNDPVLETDLTRFTPSIIEQDDVDANHLQAIIDAQQEQLIGLRRELKQKDIFIRSQAIDLASKDDQLKYMPELFNKALRLSNVEAANLLLTKDLQVEALLNEELNSELSKTKSKLAEINSHLLVKLARALGVID